MRLDLRPMLSKYLKRRRSGLNDITNLDAIILPIVIGNK